MCTVEILLVFIISLLGREKVQGYNQGECDIADNQNLSRLSFMVFFCFYIFYIKNYEQRCSLSLHWYIFFPKIISQVVYFLGNPVQNKIANESLMFTCFSISMGINFQINLFLKSLFGYDCFRKCSYFVVSKICFLLYKKKKIQIFRISNLAIIKILWFKILLNYAISIFSVLQELWQCVAQRSEYFKVII